MGYDMYNRAIATMRMISRMDWRETLRNAIKNAGLTYDDVGAEIGVTGSAVGHWLKGRRDPNMDEIRVMARMAGISLDEMFQSQDYIVANATEIAVVQQFRKLDRKKRALAEKLLASLLLD